MESEVGPLQSQEFGLSEVKYAWIILFKYCINEPEPFVMVPLSIFSGIEFPWKSVRGVMSSEFRVERRKFPIISDDAYTIFAKVEIGKFH